MNGFVNTVDVIGDAAVAENIISRRITEYKDNTVTVVGEYAFSECYALTIADLPSVTSINPGAFYKCSALETLILRAPTLCISTNTSCLYGTKIFGKNGYIYVPAALVDSYKAATSWSSFANQFRALEDYTVDGTTTGELDPTKIAA